MEANRQPGPQQPGVTDTPEFRRFEDLAGKLFQVPKVEVDTRIADEKQQKAEKPKKPARKSA